MLIERENCCVLLIDVQEKLFPLIDKHAELLQNLVWLKEVADYLSIPSLTTEQYPKGLGHTVSELSMDTDRVMEKMHFSVCSDDGIKKHIEHHKAQQYVVIGIEAHVCVMQSVLELLQAEKQVFVVSDCIGSRNDFDKQAAISRMQQAGAIIVTREMVLFEWLRVSGTDEFKHVSKTYLR